MNGEELVDMDASERMAKYHDIARRMGLLVEDLDTLSTLWGRGYYTLEEYTRRKIILRSGFRELEEELEALLCQTSG